MVFLNSRRLRLDINSFETYRRKIYFYSLNGKLHLDITFRFQPATFLSGGDVEVRSQQFDR